MNASSIINTTSHVIQQVPDQVDDLHLNNINQPSTSNEYTHHAHKAYSTLSIFAILHL